VRMRMRGSALRDDSARGGRLSRWCVDRDGLFAARAARQPRARAARGGKGQTHLAGEPLGEGERFSGEGDMLARTAEVKLLRISCVDLLGFYPMFSRVKLLRSEGPSKGRSPRAWVVGVAVTFPSEHIHTYPHLLQVAQPSSPP
jgi:hypothetical protein